MSLSANRRPDAALSAHCRPPIVAPARTALAAAAAALAAGRLVGLPTETVYGLAGAAGDALAVARIFAAKGRPAFNPLIVHVPDLPAAGRLGQLTDAARALAEAFWPGPLTLVVPRRADSGLADLVSAGLDTIALRVPAHPVARALLRTAGLPIAAPSANPSGRLSPTRAADVAGAFDAAQLSLVLDGGPCPIGVESAIVGFAGERPVLLRQGGIAEEELEAVCGPLGRPGDDRVQAPGMLLSHYAPAARLRLDAAAAEPGEALLAFGPTVPACAGPVRNLSPAGDPVEAAANLFRMLRELDALADRIAVMPVPRAGLGAAINDRLARAAAPR
ncbi:L-threonylcarbamoyladenylate synthase [Marinibaculum pumilum]|uniref:Threonylcarbamoyl-AMP synthase n=1 Tax=Marinibaculum pumilum TaxID=1766165 RepID=A0ABV7LA66_9PROT